MVMKKVTKAPATAGPHGTRRGPRRVGVAEAKARLSQVLRSLEEGPIVIHSRGRDVGALVGIDAFERLVDAESERRPAGGATFLEAVETLKRRHGGGVEGFAPPPAVIAPQDPFRRTRRK
jgi:prevent-host-death family protein